MKFIEAQLEQAIIDLLSQQEFPHVVGEHITRKPDEVCIKSNFNSLFYVNQKINRSFKVELDSVYRKYKQNHEQNQTLTDIRDKLLPQLISEAFYLPSHFLSNVQQIEEKQKEEVA